MTAPVKEKSKPTLLLYTSFSNPSSGWGNRSMHSHDFCEVMLVREGSGKISANGAQASFSKGDVIVYNPGTVHCEYHDDVTPRRVSFLGISNLSIDGLDAGKLCKGDFALLHSGDQEDALGFYVDRLFSEKETHGSQSASIVKHLLSIIISCIIRLSEDTARATEYKKTYAEIKQYMDEHYTEINTIDTLCRELFINKYYLTHLFTDTYGISPLRYVIKKKLALAKHLLVNTNMRVEEISQMVGYEDVAYFCRLFKKTEQITPLGFRKKHRQG